MEEVTTTPYFETLIERVAENYPDFSVKCMYKILVKKCKFYYEECAQMKEDKLWETIVNEAEDYESTNEDFEPSAGASFEHAMKTHKPVIIELIKKVIKEESEEEEDEDDDDQGEEGDSSENPNQLNQVNRLSNQVGSGLSKEYLRRYGLY